MERGADLAGQVAPRQPVERNAQGLHHGLCVPLFLAALRLAGGALGFGLRAMLRGFRFRPLLGAARFLEDDDGLRHRPDLVLARGFRGDGDVFPARDAAHRIGKGPQRAYDAARDEEGDAAEKDREYEAERASLEHGCVALGDQVIHVHPGRQRDLPGNVALDEDRLRALDRASGLFDDVADVSRAHALDDIGKGAAPGIAAGIDDIHAALADRGRIAGIDDGVIVDVANEEVIAVVVSHVADDGVGLLAGLRLAHRALVDEFLVRIEHGDGDIDELLQPLVARGDRALVGEPDQGHGHGAAAEDEQGNEEMQACRNRAHGGCRPGNADERQYSAGMVKQGL